MTPKSRLHNAARSPLSSSACCSVARAARCVCHRLPLYHTPKLLRRQVRQARHMSRSGSAPDEASR